MDPQRQIIDWLQQDNARMAALRTVRRLGLNDWCLGAGFVRNLVWDRRHGYTEPTPLNDIDVIHFDAERADAERDRMLEVRLQQWLPRPWSVKNQARMHLRGGRAPYRDSEEAISFWTEVETAIGARRWWPPSGSRRYSTKPLPLTRKTAIARPMPSACSTKAGCSVGRACGR